MNNLILNRCAVWRAKNVDELTKRAYAPGRVYFSDNVAYTSEKPLFRYAKNYKRGKGVGALKFCLFVVVESDAESSVEAFLDDIAGKVDEAIIEKVVADDDGYSFDYLDFYYKGGK